MTDAEHTKPPIPQERLAPEIVELRREAGRRLGQLAQYLAEKARIINTPGMPLPLGELAIASAGLGDITTALTHINNSPENVGELAEAYAALQDMSFAPKHDTLSRHDYPDIPFYAGTLAAEEIPDIDDSPDEQLPFYILSETYVQFNGELIELTGEALYVFNAFLKYRRTFVGHRVHVSQGFRKSANEGVTRSRYHIALKKLLSKLQPHAPKGCDIILEQGSTKFRTRRLNPILDICDVRGDPAFTQLLPKPFLIDTSETQGTRGYPFAYIARQTGANHETIWRRITPEERAAIFNGPGGIKLFPTDVTTAIINRFTEKEIPIMSLPDTHVRVSSLLAQLPIGVTMRRAVTILSEAGLHPEKLNIDPTYAWRGGIWCVEKEGALETLLAVVASTRRKSSPVIKSVQENDQSVQPSQPLPRRRTVENETPAPIELQARNTAAMIAEYLNKRGIQVSAQNVANEANGDTKITQERNAEGEIVYSLYAAKRIIRAFGGEV